MKMFLLLLFCSFAIIACQVISQNSAQANKSALSTGTKSNNILTIEGQPAPLPVDHINQQMATAMHQHFNEKNGHVKKDSSVQIEISTDDLRTILDTTQATSVKFFLAAYPDNPNNPRDKNKANQAIILMQTRREGNTSSAGGTNAKHPHFYIITTNYYAARSLCPPPAGGCTL